MLWERRGQSTPMDLPAECNGSLHCLKLGVTAGKQVVEVVSLYRDSERLRVLGYSRPTP